MKLILFDVDGTLLNAGGSGRWAMARAFEEVFGIQDATPYAQPVRFDGMTDPQILKEIAGHASIPEPLLHEKAANLERSFLGHLEARLAGTDVKRPLPGVVDLLERLAGVHMAQTGLLTGNIEAGARLKLASFGLSGYFEIGGFGGDAADRAGIGRVARHRFEQRLKAAIEPSDIVAVGDSLEDVRAARSNGYRSLAVGTGWTDPERLLAEGPDLFLADLSDFGAAMQFIFGARGV